MENPRLTKQGQLFAQAFPASTDAPTCPSCRLRQVGWSLRKRRYQSYCGGNSCNNHERRCHWCETVYDRSSPRSGTKYCGVECKQKALRAGALPPKTNRLPCRFCGKPTSTPGSVCRPCAQLTPWADTLRRHNAPDWIWEHMSAAGTCMNPGCNEDLRGRKKRSGAYLTSVCVDHDHNCCSSSTSCGSCVRGILCVACNQALGLLRNDESIIAGLGKYLALKA